MYARLLASVCLLSCSVLIGRSEPLSVPKATVGVYVQVDATASSLSLDSMRQEVRELMSPAGLDVVWVKRNDPTPVDKFVVVELRGNCQSKNVNGAEFKDRTALASTAITDGEVLPFSWVNCLALNRFLAGSLTNHSGRERNEIYGRALARVIAHELYHVITESQAHTVSGISKEAFSLSDLLAPELTFQREALAMLQPQPNQTPVVTAELRRPRAFDFDFEFGMDLEAFEDPLGR